MCSVWDGWSAVEGLHGFRIREMSRNSRDMWDQQVKVKFVAHSVEVCWVLIYLCERRGCCSVPFSLFTYTEWNSRQKCDNLAFPQSNPGWSYCGVVSGFGVFFLPLFIKVPTTTVKEQIIAWCYLQEKNNKRNLIWMKKEPFQVNLWISGLSFNIIKVKKKIKSTFLFYFLQQQNIKL